MIGTATPARLPMPAGISRERASSVEERFHSLMQECERPLYGYLVNLMRDTDLAQDCFQDTFLRAHQALQRGQTVTRQWLFRVAHNRAVDEFRRRRHSRPDLEALEQVHATGDRPDGRIDVQSVMEMLDPLDREVLHLFVLAGYKTDEIGEMIGVSGAAVRQRLYRARERFRALYGEAA